MDGLARSLVVTMGGQVDIVHVGPQKRVESCKYEFPCI
jgi:hypothetical protein